MWRSTFAVLVLTLPGLAQTHTAAINVSLDGYVIGVKANKLSVVLKTDSPGRSLSYGTADPVISPDGKSIAFIRDRNIYLRDTADSTDYRLTTAGADDTPKLLSVDHMIIGFSLDSTSLYYAVVAGKADSPDSPGPQPQQRVADYGIFRYNPTGRPIKIAIPGSTRLVGVLSDNRLLASSVGSYGDQIGTLSLDTMKFAPFPDRCAGAFECSADLNGTDPVCVALEGGNPQVISCNTKSGKVTDISKPGSCGSEFTHEKRSPDGSRVSYLRSTNGCVGADRELWIDQKAVFKCDALSDYAWVDKTRVLARCEHEFALIDVSGKKLGSVPAAKSIPKENRL